LENGRNPYNPFLASALSDMNTNIIKFIDEFNQSNEQQSIKQDTHTILDLKQAIVKRYNEL
jgi:hypothetical protein